MLAGAAWNLDHRPLGAENCSRCWAWFVAFHNCLARCGEAGTIRSDGADRRQRVGMRVTTMVELPYACRFISHI